MHLLEASLGRHVVLALALALGTAGAAVLFAAPCERGRIVVTETETEILDVVRFAPGTSTLEPSSTPILDAVAATLVGNPSIELVEVQAHTSGLGDGAANLALTEQRAAVVMAYLFEAGVDPSRLVGYGYGDTQPIDPQAGSPKNERIAFLILERASDASE